MDWIHAAPKRDQSKFSAHSDNNSSNWDACKMQEEDRKTKDHKNHRMIMCLAGKETAQIEFTSEEEMLKQHCKVWFTETPRGSI